MLRKILLWGGIAVGLIVAVVVIAVGAVYLITNNRMTQTYNITIEPVDIPTDEEALAWGEHIATIRGCTDCHGGNLAGATVIDDPAIGVFYGPNLTPGEGGLGEAYANDDIIVQAIRHGVGPDNQPLLFMPSHEFYVLSDRDLGSLITYIRNLPPVDKPNREVVVGPIARVLYLQGQFDLIPAERINHDTPVPEPPDPGVTVAYGEYMSTGCVGCHGHGYSGGPIPGVPPDWPEAPNLTPGGDLADWSEEDFITAMRTGTTPAGEVLDAEYMPWPAYSEMTDTELQAIYAYLQSLPPTETGNR